MTGIDLRMTGTDPTHTSIRGIYPSPAYETSLGPPGIHAHLDTTPYGLNLRYDIWLAPGDHRVLFWAAGDVSSWSWRAEPRGSMELSFDSASQKVLFLDGSETREGLHAHAATSGAGVAASSATYDVEIDDSFVGIAGWRGGVGHGSTKIDPSASRVTATSPDGVVQDCVCDSPVFDNDRSVWGRGTHTLRWDGVDAFSVGRTPILLAGADAPIRG